MSDLNQESWTKQLKSDNNAVVLDVRTDMEIAEGFIPNAIQLFSKSNKKCGYFLISMIFPVNLVIL